MPSLTKDAARNRLAVELYEKMRRLDCDGPPWSKLTKRERSLYRLAINHVLDFRELVLDAVADSGKFAEIKLRESPAGAEEYSLSFGIYGVADWRF